MAGFRIPLTSDMLHIGTLVKVASPIVPEGTELEIPVDSFGVFRAFDDDGDVISIFQINQSSYQCRRRTFARCLLYLGIVYQPPPSINSIVQA